MPSKVSVVCLDCEKERLVSSYHATYKKHDRCLPCAMNKYFQDHPRELTKKAYAAWWYQNHKRQQSGYYAEYRKRVRVDMVAAYGGSCIHCGEDDPVVLVLDHIYDDGAKDKKRKGGTRGGTKLYLRLKMAGWPKDRHQLLCHNCNFRKEYARRKEANAFKIIKTA